MADKIVVMRDGRDRADRRAARALRPAGQPVRRRLHRLAGDELPARRRCSSAAAARRVELDDGTPLRGAAQRRRQRRPAGRLRHAARAPRARATMAASPSKVVVVEPTGADTLVACRHGGTEIAAVFRERHDFAPGSTIHLHARPRARASVRRGAAASGSPPDARSAQSDAHPRTTTKETSDERLSTAASSSKARPASPPAPTLGTGTALWSPAAHAQTLTLQAREGRQAARAALEPLRAGRHRRLHGQHQEVHRARPASRCASTTRAGKTCGRRRRSPPTSAPAPTSSCRPTTTPTCIRTSCSTSPTSPTTSARSTAAGTRPCEAYLQARRQEVDRRAARRAPAR